uniref:NADH-ubiquinone oxidoreductase chain 3 n=1 Tax=Protambulyx astygonus TaxID=1088141 RepID=A0A6G6D8D8_9NEOP|nr:NADH dehydrogenase subunit 3 [Protambulyx astygonus]QIE12694.1 NADH dehydrogenase subunit 3 [Protambulyx astygonus]
MNLMMMISILILMISNIMMLMSFTLSKKSTMDREKCSPFECGFDPKSSARIPFSLHFFLITVIFIIFDIEIALIFPIILSLKITNILINMKISFFFISILLMGLYHEWNQNMLNWTN